MNKPEFYEGYHNPDADESNNEFAGDFDWDSLYDRMGELKDAEIELINRKLLMLLQWIVDPVQHKKLSRKRVSSVLSKRVMALAWVICPQLFSGKSSMTHTASMLGMHKAVLSELTAAFSKQFGVRNKSQIGHAWNFNPQIKNNNEQTIHTKAVDRPEGVGAGNPRHLPNRTPVRRSSHKA
jgi:hypothetical protein